MREALFVKQNTQRWKDYENLKDEGPDALAESFISITDDLAYAKTFYPKSNTTKYLNGLAASFHHQFIRTKKKKSAGLFFFGNTSYRSFFISTANPFYIRFVFRCIIGLIGAISARYDNTFVRLILGDSYVNTTNANISKGDPFGVYKQGNSFLMFLQIAFNNIVVELTTFVMGIIFSVGSIYQLMNNGLMMGSFQYYFFSRGLGWQSIW